MTSDSSDDLGAPADVGRLYAAFVAHAHAADEPPEGFGEWVENLHDVYLNVETAWLTSLLVPPSDVEHMLAEVGGSRRQRLARFLARDMWVLWEAWERRPEYHEAFARSGPTPVMHLRELEALGKEAGWFKRVRNIRDYMNHRDKRAYLDPGREELPEEAIAWMHELRRTFSELLLSAMGIPLPRGEFREIDDLGPRNSTIREIATSAVDDLLVGTASAMRVGAEDKPDATASVTGHFGRAFVSAVCGSPQLWSECFTALIRRSVVAWSRLGAVPELRRLVLEMEFEHNAQMFRVAIVTAPVNDVQLPLEDLSRLAVHRATEWFNGHGDLRATLAAAVSVAGVLTSVATTIEPENADVADFVHQLGVVADALLDDV